MTPELIETLLFATVRASTPLLIAGLGILLLEKSGVLNLGQEGLVSFGAVIAFIVAFKTNSYVLALFAAAFSGVFIILIFSFLVLVCKANQVVSGLALSIFGVGLAAFISSAYIGESISGIGETSVPVLSQIPWIGKIFFTQDCLVYLSWGLAVALFLTLYKTRWGMIVRGVGENPESAHALGYSPNRVRFLVLLVSAALVAIAGAYLSLVYTPVLSEGLSSGRGWIALSLVVFASHLISRLLVGAILFGFMSVLHLAMQGSGLNIGGSILAMMPYVMTILALVLMSIRDRNIRSVFPLAYFVKIRSASTPGAIPSIAVV